MRIYEDNSVNESDISKYFSPEFLKRLDDENYSIEYFVNRYYDYYTEHVDSIVDAIDNNLFSRVDSNELKDLIVDRLFEIQDNVLNDPEIKTADVSEIIDDYFWEDTSDIDLFISDFNWASGWYSDD